MMADMANVSQYLCWACERLGSAAEATSTIVLRYRDGDVIRYAHAACTPSTIVPVDDDSPLGPPNPPRPDVPPCSSDDVAVTLRWEPGPRGLDGHLVITNTSGHTCRLEGKPWVTPNDPHGRPMAVPCWQTEEFMVPGYCDLRPGQRAEAILFWRTWCGPAVGPTATVGWAGGSAPVTVTGPVQPPCRDPGDIGGIAANPGAWFRLLEGPPAAG